MSAKNPDSGRNKDVQANRYRDPLYAKKKRAEREKIDSDFDRLAGPVEVRKVEP